MHSALPATDVPEVQFIVQRKNGGRVSCSRSTSNTVIRIDRSQERPVPAGARLLDSFLEEFASHPDVAPHMERARTELAKEHIAAGAEVTLRLLRIQLGLSQAQLAEKLGTSQAAVSEYECRRRKPAEDMIRAMAATLAVDFNTLMDALANG